VHKEVNAERTMPPCCVMILSSCILSLLVTFEMVATTCGEGDQKYKVVE